MISKKNVVSTPNAIPRMRKPHCPFCPPPLENHELFILGPPIIKSVGVKILIESFCLCVYLQPLGALVCVRGDQKRQWRTQTFPRRAWCVCRRRCCCRRRLHTPAAHSTRSCAASAARRTRCSCCIRRVRRRRPSARRPCPSWTTCCTITKCLRPPPGSPTSIPPPA